MAMRRKARGSFAARLRFSFSSTLQGNRQIGVVRSVWMRLADAMHDEEWTRRAVAGFKSQLGKLEEALSHP